MVWLGVQWPLSPLSRPLRPGCSCRLLSEGETAQQRGEPPQCVYVLSCATGTGPAHPETAVYLSDVGCKADLQDLLRDAYC